MQLHTIHTGNFMLDGGAMFGVVPKSLWSRHMTADANNLCSWAMRCLLIENGENLLLVDTGIGSKQSEKFFSHYHLHGDDSLDRSLAERGFSRADITDVLCARCGCVAAWHDVATIDGPPSDVKVRPHFFDLPKFHCSCVLCGCFRLT